MPLNTLSAQDRSLTQPHLPHAHTADGEARAGRQPNVAGSLLLLTLTGILLRKWLLLITGGATLGTEGRFPG